jgi:hypothetical protein
MLDMKTHFEQVPLAAVRKILEQQIERETTTEHDQIIREEALQEDLWEAQEQIMSKTRKSPEVEAWKQS